MRITLSIIAVFSIVIVSVPAASANAKQIYTARGSMPVHHYQQSYPYQPAPQYYYVQPVVAAPVYQYVYAYPAYQPYQSYAQTSYGYQSYYHPDYYYDDDHEPFGYRSMFYQPQFPRFYPYNNQSYGSCVTYGQYARYATRAGGCSCTDGYAWNPQGTECVPARKHVTFRNSGIDSGCWRSDGRWSTYPDSSCWCGNGMMWNQNRQCVGASQYQTHWDARLR